MLAVGPSPVGAGAAFLPPDGADCLGLLPALFPAVAPAEACCGALSINAYCDEGNGEI